MTETVGGVWWVCRASSKKSAIHRFVRTRKRVGVSSQHFCITHFIEPDCRARKEVAVGERELKIDDEQHYA
ncbi:hypothetical protein [Salinigranum salinum]|uniref:hypothetical protein n=1 Tax=Salinigranum salinum TaxID=1364937 RepID=UPI0012606DAF|nr:hypothetical protein [Salinigranum salinum]